MIADIFRRAVLDLGLPPDAVWRLSLREWRWLTEPRADAALGARGLADLMNRYPDETR